MGTNHQSLITDHAVSSLTGNARRAQHIPMDIVSTVALVAGLGWASGMRLYAVLFFLGVIHHVGAATLPASLEVLGHPVVMAVSGALFAIEFFVDKIPGFDTLWDAVHTFVRVPAGALLAAYAVSADDPGFALAAGLLGGAVAAGTHLVKAGGRAAINASPEPFSNWAASLTEDFSALAIVWLALNASADPPRGARAVRRGRAVALAEAVARDQAGYGFNPPNAAFGISPRRTGDQVTGGRYFFCRRKTNWSSAGFGRQQGIAGLPGERLEILHRTGIRRQNAQHLARAHVGQRLFRPQNRQRTVQAARVEFLVDIHSHPVIWRRSCRTSGIVPQSENADVSIRKQLRQPQIRHRQAVHQELQERAVEVVAASASPPCALPRRAGAARAAAPPRRRAGRNRRRRSSGRSGAAPPPP